jgi:hypothetical protein
MNERVTVNAADGWADAAADNAENAVRGTLLKFSDWLWFRGKESTKLDEGTVAVETSHAWVKWQDKKPVEYRMRVPGKKLPEREELGDHEESNWEVGPDGKTKKDPWQNTRFLYLFDPLTAESYTFTTSSWGGRSAVVDLADQIQRVRTARPGAVPVVELCAAPMATKFGKKSKPHFKVVEWRGGAPVEEAPMQIAHVAESENAFADEIPF